MEYPRSSRLLSDVAALVLCGLLAGVVVAAAALPALAVTGLGAKSAADSFESLPSEISAEPLPQKSVLLASDGKTQLTTFYGDENRVLVPLERIPLVMQQAIIAAEDERFYEHRGVDARGVVRAAVTNFAAGAIEEGASTITQQYVRQVLLRQAETKEEVDAATGQDAGRKLREMRYAIALEKELSKDDILGRYLNTVYFGARAYGVQTAANAYFSKPVEQLTLGEAATLAGIVKSPDAFDPTKNDPADAIDRRDYTLTQMAGLGFITQADADAAIAAPLTLTPGRAPNNCANINPAIRDAGFFCEWFRDWWAANPAFGSTPDERIEKLNTGGYRIVSSLDLRMQKAATEAAVEELAVDQRYATGAVLIEPGTGRVKAMGVNRIFNPDSTGNKPHPIPALAAQGQKASYPNTSLPLLTGSATSPGYQAGSTFKMFTMVAALEKGLPLSTLIDSPNQVVTSAPDGSDAACDGKYCPSNASPRMAGRHTMWSGFGESVNTYFVQLEEAVGLQPVIDTALKMGVQIREAPLNDSFATKAEEMVAGNALSFTLGTVQATPLDMANAYATVAARGIRCDPSPVISAVDPTGAEVPWAAPQCERVIPEGVADAAANAALCPVGDPTDDALGRCSINNGPTGRSGARGIERPIAGKTGSTNDNRTSWFVGFTPNLAGASFIVDPDEPIKSIPRGGGSVPYRVFNGAMKSALELLPEAEFVEPPDVLVEGGVKVTVPSVGGDAVDDAAEDLRRAGFTVRVSQTPVDSTYREGRTAYTTPRGGSKASKGSLVTIYRSNGEDPEPDPRPSRPRADPSAEGTPDAPDAPDARPDPTRPGRGTPRTRPPFLEIPPPPD